MYFDNWTKESIPNETIAEIKSKQKQAIGKYDFNNLLQWVDLYDFEEYLFGENYLSIVTGNEKNIVRYKEIDIEELLNLFREVDDLSISKPYSLWNEVFSKYIDIDLKEIQNDMELIREGRNIVSHNKEIQLSLYQQLIKNLKKYVKQLDEAFQKILIGEIAENELSDMSDDFEGYVDHHFNNLDMMDVAGISELAKSAIKPVALAGLRETLATSQNLAQRLNKMAINQTALTRAGEALATSQNLAQRLNKIAINQTALTRAGEALAISQNLAQRLNKMAINQTALTTVGETLATSKEIQKIKSVNSELDIVHGDKKSGKNLEE